MNELITTDEQLDALPVGTIVARLHHDGRGNSVYTRVEGKDGWRLATERLRPGVSPRFDQDDEPMADLVVIYRPDHPNLGERVLPTEAEIADALHADACPEDPDDGESCTCADYMREARIVLELFASQPTVAQVKAEAWGEGYVAACDRYGHELGTYGDRMEPNPYRESEG